MEWVAIPKSAEPRQYLPLQDQFLALWKRAIFMVQFDEDEKCFFMCNQPSEYPGVMKLDREREAKFSHYCLLERPKDY